jgi:hypothetical protein
MEFKTYVRFFYRHRFGKFLWSSAPQKSVETQAATQSSGRIFCLFTVLIVTSWSMGAGPYGRRDKGRRVE